MGVNEFDPDDFFGELNRKFANVSLEQDTSEDIYREIVLSDVNTLENSSDYHACHTAMKNIRRYLTQDISLERIQNVLDLDIHERIRTILLEPGYDELKYETAWTITNLAFGTSRQTHYLIESGIIDSMVRCFRTSDNYRTAWALANVSIESPDYRSSMAQENLIGDVAEALTEKCESIAYKLANGINAEQYRTTLDGYIIVEDKVDRDDVKDLTWSLANICRGGFKTVEHWEQYLHAFDAFSVAINYVHKDIWREACWGLSRILSNMYNFDQFFRSLHLSTRLCPRLVNLLKHQEMSTVLPALQTVSNFSSGPNDYIEILLDADLLNSVWWYMTPDTPQQLRRNAILTVSNLAAGDNQIVRKVVYNENIMKSVIAHIVIPGHVYLPEDCKWIESNRSTIPETKEEWKIIKEALYVLSNITTLADDDSICALLRNYPSIIKLLAYLLYFHRMNASVCLKVVDVLIRIVERTNQISELTPPVQPNPRNPYAEEMMREGVIPALTYLCREIKSIELTEQTEILHVAIMSSSPHPQQQPASSASAFGLSRLGIQLPTPNVRRIVHGYEDGDVRLIEEAIGAFSL
ncbi:armadillo-type protein [Mucor mucedo]|uniref:armadillo-type protein n=1 Tax=Mucor mucedo TaxID=29922 RepID=UPI00221F33ED|nr:armadillo-type protein [Mucor mucedo]KAI7893062.1 armadillo-type protein [Mucor mucedo]